MNQTNVTFLFSETNRSDYQFYVQEADLGRRKQGLNLLKKREELEQTVRSHKIAQIAIATFVWALLACSAIFTSTAATYLTAGAVSVVAALVAHRRLTPDFFEVQLKI